VSADDQRLIAECLAGNTAAFGELVNRYQDRLYNTLVRVMDHSEDARDVVQESFLHAYLSLPAFKGDARFFTWLYRIGVNTAISMKRKQKPALRLHGGPEGGTGLEPLDPSEVNRPGHVLESAEEERRVHDALSRLSQEHRAVLVMKDMDGMKYEEMAEVLSVPIGTIRSRLHRARLELRDLLVQEEHRADQKPK
jgi:RNA polymerase sigma-70 factor, ECF subfamily